jgi:stringent starvation protein B
MDSASAKREFAIALLQESSVFVHLDPRREGAKVPGWLKRQPQLVLQIGLNMAVNIPDLDIGEDALCCTLSFNRSPFFCRVPWTAVFGLVGEDGRGRIWPEDVPLEIAAQMQQQSTLEGPKEATKAQRNPARARLQALPSPAAAATGGETPRQAPKELAAVPAVAHAETPAQPGMSSESDAKDAPKPEARPKVGKSVRPSSAPASPGKREMPSYLRVVK